MKNSDYRQFANATQVEPSKALRTVLIAVAIIVPATGVFVYRSGFFATGIFANVLSGVRGIISPESRPVASPAPAAPPSAGAAPVPFAPPPAAPSGSLTGTFSSNGASPGTSPGAGSPAVKNPADLAKALNLALKMQMNMGMVFEMVAEEMETFGNSRAEVPTERLIEYCRVQARRRLNDQGYGRGGRRASESFMFDVMAERVYCMMTRRPDKLCEPPVKGEFLKQFTNYLKIRNGALSELFGVAGTEAGAPLKAGVHRAVNEELRKLATRGYITTRDFGWFPPEDVKQLIGDIKPAKPACKG